MTTLADCFPQSQKPPKLKLGMVICHEDDYRDRSQPCIIVGIRQLDSNANQEIMLELLTGHDCWTRRREQSFRKDPYPYRDDVTYDEISSALGYQKNELHKWRIWTKEEVSEWFLKNYPTSS